jgi:hypothetical protein
MNTLERVAHLNKLIAANVQRLSESFGNKNIPQSSVADCYAALETYRSERMHLLYREHEYVLILIDPDGGKKVIAEFNSMYNAYEYMDNFEELLDPSKYERTNVRTIITVDGYVRQIEEREAI